jgi:hypothetical protein
MATSELPELREKIWFSVQKASSNDRKQTKSISWHDTGERAGRGIFCAKTSSAGDWQRNLADDPMCKIFSTFEPFDNFVSSTITI